MDILLDSIGVINTSTIRRGDSVSYASADKPYKVLYDQVNAYGTIVNTIELIAKELFGIGADEMLEIRNKLKMSGLLVVPMMKSSIGGREVILMPNLTRFEGDLLIDKDFIFRAKRCRTYRDLDAKSLSVEDAAIVKRELSIFMSLDLNNVTELVKSLIRTANQNLIRLAYDEPFHIWFHNNNAHIIQIDIQRVMFQSNADEDFVTMENERNCLGLLEDIKKLKQEVIMLGGLQNI